MTAVTLTAKRRIVSTMSSLYCSLLLAWAMADGPSPLERVGKLDVRLVPEASGIVKSRRHAGVFWVHNDSGNPPSLFAIRADGRVVREFRLEVPNIDWEDIAIDDKGHLYVGDIGNTGRASGPRDLSDRRARPGRAGVRADQGHCRLAYALPRGNRFDAESLDYDHGNAIVIAKYLDGREAEVFSIGFGPPLTLARPVEPGRSADWPGSPSPRRAQT